MFSFGKITDGLGFDLSFAKISFNFRHVNVFLFLDTILQIRNMSSLHRARGSYCKFLRLLRLSVTVVARDQYFS